MTNIRKILMFFLLYIFLHSSMGFTEGKMYSGSRESHCELWSLERLLGQKSTCRRRAGKSSEKPITCRFKSSYPNEDDPELTMCVYERAGYKMDDLIISSEGGLPCAKEFLCKRQ